MAYTAEQIRKLCDDWCASVVAPHGGLHIGGDSERHRLIANGVDYTELDYEALCAAIVGTSRVLLRPGMITAIDFDHYFLWAWCAEILLDFRVGTFTREQSEIGKLFELAIHASLATCNKPPESEEEHIEQRRIFSSQPHHAKKFLENYHLTLAYLVFPLLEAVVKKSCSTYIASDGAVLANFSVPGKGTRASINYGPASGARGAKRQCSSLRDLLYLLYGKVASPGLVSNLDRLRYHITELDNTVDPFDLIYRWRNQSLHGSTNFMTIGGTLLNLSLLILISDLEQNFDQIRSDVCSKMELKRKQMRLTGDNRDPWSFYPPF